jgi:hypothetical protein
MQDTGGTAETRRTLPTGSLTVTDRILRQIGPQPEPPSPG